jgi:uncharacterized membrane protein YkgB
MATKKVGKQQIHHLDVQMISFFKKTYVPLARSAFFVVFFWFGFIKLTGLSPAGPLAEALTAQTIGSGYFDVAFKVLALLECLIGILFLFPKAVRVVIPLLFFHMTVVCAPLLLLPDLTWQAPFTPTLEGQYIIKNIVIVALAFGVAAHTQPLVKNKDM